jgi:hypothetical protein
MSTELETQQMMQKAHADSTLIRIKVNHLAAAI